MSNKYITFYLIISFLLISNNATTKETKETGKIIVEITGFRSNDGEALSHLFTNPEFFPSKSRKAIKWNKNKIQNNRAVIVFEEMPFGNYALTTHHDENSNGKMDKSWTGLPAEGWGLSNNPTVIFKLPHFDECKFLHTSDSTFVKVKLKY